jgi:O-antigen/teichoic acid export membrane protein
MVLNIVLNFVLIPRFMAVGSAYASLITQFFTAILQVVMVQRLFRFRVDRKFLLSIGLFVFAVIGITLAVRYAGLEWKTGFILAVAGSGLVALGFRLISFRGIIGILRNN